MALVSILGEIATMVLKFTQLVWVCMCASELTCLVEYLYVEEKKKGPSLHLRYVSVHFSPVNQPKLSDRCRVFDPWIRVSSVHTCKGALQQGRAHARGV